MPDSHERTAAALGVLRRGSRAGSAGNVAYVVYVVAVFAIVYGFPYGRTILATLGAERVSQLAADPVTIVLLVLGYAGLLGLAHRGGRISGPVSPPPIWCSHVLTAPIDRAVALRRWWRLTLGGLLGGGAVLGVVLGLSLWSAGTTGWLAVPAAAALLACGAWLLALVWLHAQGSADQPLDGASTWRPDTALRRMGVESLLAQAGRREMLMAGALSGSSETIRAQTGRASVQAKGSLRPGPWIVLRRDLLSLRRAGPGWPAPFVVVLTGGWILAQAINADLPGLAGVSAAIVYLGATPWGRPLRLQAARLGSPSLLGWSHPAQAARHLLLPTILLTACLTAGVAVAGELAALLPTLALVPILLAVLCWSAFRPPPRLTTVIPQSVIPRLVMWWLAPVLLIAPAAGLAAWRLG
ncbi:hypothetical protein JNO54_09105 [Janibacter sp. YIM B02568]|uniref:hypothetical protein n=1 Tax=Janibacter endophyticus TaxID=2806261 RepID=UPI001952749A|nr:hypothetical protein [Janibacter endophyticus]MBM6546294.1 hypothetical protein [Janibacter endophyticus]